jgi:hypothetical protein
MDVFGLFYSQNMMPLIHQAENMTEGITHTSV